MARWAGATGVELHADLPARLLERDYGTVEVGKVADLLVLAADPTARIGNTRRIALVIEGGAAHTR